ncbi:hypothetical protein L210DRAFT_3137872 [Boletus edulis BED1]|uniref:Uncharacterized protein n=1 Tax=Boletus edulis BED1 TaxID=1328754 RepID=A0AAD4BGS8_BOLED|nr:hypothetical protein L210DRAFT_3137872 [Boletus edulis BED1]
MSSYTRTLTFTAQDLGTDVTLMLIFDKASDGLYDKFPVVWKVSMFGAAGSYQFIVTFSSQSLNTDFQPVLRAYITNEYTEGQIVKDQISTPIIWERDLSSLDNITVWNLECDPPTGRFSIDRA